MSNKPSMDLKSEVKEIMFLPDNDVIIMSKNPSKFVEMMSLLTSYETQVACGYLTVSYLSDEQ